MRKQKRRIIWPRVWAATLLLYIVLGGLYSAIDEQKHPERYAHCEPDSICIIKR